MRYIVDVAKKQAEKIETLIKSEKYENVNQFVSVAIENQLYLETSGGNTEITGVRAGAGSNIFANNDVNVIKKSSTIDIDISMSMATEVPQYVESPSYNELVPFNDGIKEEKSWMWGQYNRIFPAKIALRYLAVKLGGKQWITLDDYREEAAGIALKYHEAITFYEDENNKKRDDRISAGLPRNSDDPYKRVSSLSRFKDHFIGCFRQRDGKILGMLPFLRFANIKNDAGNTYIGITEDGYKFAKLNNPVVDESNFDNSFSEEEMNFYLSHIKKNVRGELDAFNWILTKIKKGIIKRPALNEVLKNEYAKIWETKEKVINTQRAGLIGRVYEFGLIEKTKKGITVEYSLSEKGINFLK